MTITIIMVVSGQIYWEQDGCYDIIDKIRKNSEPTIKLTSNNLPDGYSLEIIDNRTGGTNSSIPDFNEGYNYRILKIKNNYWFLTIDENNINPNKFIEKSTIHITAETELDKNIADADVTINWVKPQFNILENSNNGVIKYALDTKFEYNLHFEIIPQAQIDYTFEPDWNKFTYEITELDQAIADKIYIEYTNR